jgi:hypothetical protein
MDFYTDEVVPTHPQNVLPEPVLEYRAPAFGHAVFDPRELVPTSQVGALRLVVQLLTP